MRPAVGRLQAQQVAQQGALARAAAAHDDQDLALPDLEVDVVEDPALTVMADEIPDLDHGLAAAGGFWSFKGLGTLVHVTVEPSRASARQNETAAHAPFPINLIFDREGGF
jgi:hypothetical protein